MCLPLPYHHIIPTTNLAINLAINLALINNMMPVCHILATNVVSAKKPARSNGLSTNCTTPSLVPRLPEILRCYVRLKTLKNLVHLQSHLNPDSVCHRIVILILTTPTTSSMLDTPQDILAGLTATFVVAPEAVITIIMIVATDALPAHATTATILAIMIFQPMPSKRQIWTTNDISKKCVVT